MGTYRGWGGPSYRAYGGGRGFGGFSWPPLTPIVKKLILLNAAVYVFSLPLKIFAPLWYHTFTASFGLVPGRFLFEFHLWQPLTYLFLHGDFWHIFFNMFGLWMFGSALERDWGRRRFLRYYLLTGVGAGLFSVLANFVAVAMNWVPSQTMHIPTIGASGAIYGILLAFGLLYPNTPVLFALVFPIPARIFVLIFGGLTFFSALSAPGSGVSHVAHLGGMLFGLAYLRGGWLRQRTVGRYLDWKLRQRRRNFEVYMREQDERDRDRPRPDRWVN